MKSADKMFAIFETLCQQGGASVSELSSILDQPKSSVCRFLAVLVENEYVQQNEATKKYHPTLKVFRLGSLVRDRVEIVDVARPVMADLGKKLKETVSLAVFDNQFAVYVHKVESPEAIRAHYVVGTRMAAYCTAVGKIFLSEFSEKNLEEYLSRMPLKAKTVNTIVDPEVLKKELKSIRANGWAFDNGEFDKHNQCVAAPIKDEKEKIVAALSVSGPVSRMGLERMHELKNQVMNAAETISHEMGF